MDDDDAPRRDPRRPTPRDVLATIAMFRDGEITLAALLNRTWDQVHDLPESPALGIGALGDIWTGIEVVYAMASAEGRRALTDEEAEDVRRSISALADAMEAAMRRLTPPVL